MNAPLTDCRDLIDVAKQLVLDGLTEPGVLTARVAIERTLRRVVSRHGLPVDVANRIGAGRLSHALKVAKRVGESLHRDIVEINGDLSRVAHGTPINLHDAVRLVERAERVRKRIERKTK